MATNQFMNEDDVKTMWNIIKGYFPPVPTASQAGYVLTANSDGTYSWKALPTSTSSSATS